MMAEMMIEIRQDGIEQLRTAAGVSLDRRSDSLLSKVMVPNPCLGHPVGVQQELISFGNRHDQPFPS